VRAIFFTERELEALAYVFGQQTSYVYGQEFADISLKIGEVRALSPLVADAAPCSKPLRLGRAMRVIPLLKPGNPEDPE